MSRERELPDPINLDDLDPSELLHVFRDVMITRQPRTIIEHDEAVLVVNPVRTARRSRLRGAVTSDDPFYQLIGAGESPEPTDIATTKHQDVANAADHR